MIFRKIMRVTVSVKQISIAQTDMQDLSDSVADDIILLFLTYMENFPDLLEKPRKP